MVSGCGLGVWSRGGGRSAPQDARGWCTRVIRYVFSDGSSEVRFAGGGRPAALAGVQLRRLPESAGVRERALLGEGNRAKDGDGEPGEGKSVGCRLIFSESGGTECERSNLAGAPVAGPGTAGKSGGGVWRAGPDHVVAVGAATLLCLIRGVWERADFRAGVVAVFVLQPTLRAAIASSICRVCAFGDFFRFPIRSEDSASWGVLEPLGERGHDLGDIAGGGVELWGDLAGGTHLLSR